METETNDHCVKNATASQLLTIIDVETKSTIGRSVMHVYENLQLQQLQLQHGSEQGIQKINLVKCVVSLQDTHTNLMYTM